MQRLTFDNPGDFAAADAAEAWCTARGLSVGRMERGQPRGLLYGEFDIAKWRNLSGAERAALHGRMTGDMRHGPIVIEVCPPPAVQAVAP